MDIFSLSASFTVDTSGLESGLQKAQTGFAGIGAAADSADSAVASFAAGSSAVVSSLGASFEAAWNDVRNSWSGAEAYFSGIASSISSTFTSLSSTISQTGQNMWTGLTDGFDAAYAKLNSSLGVMAGFSSSTVDFASSALGKSSSAQINTMLSGMSERGGDYNINLVVDGRTLANVVFDPLNAVSKQKGVSVGA